MICLYLNPDQTWLIFMSTMKAQRLRGAKEKETNPNSRNATISLVCDRKNANFCASLINCKLRCGLEPLDIPRDATAVSASPTIFVHSSLALEKSVLDSPVNMYILFSCPEQLNRTHCPSLAWSV